MARVIKRIEDATWYVPDIDDNRADPEPFMVQITPLSGIEMRRLERTGMGKITRGRGEVNFLKRAQETQEKIISEKVLDVKNYAVQNPSTGEILEPSDGASLVKAILLAGAKEVEILDDILEAMKDSSRLDEGLLGNLNLQFDSVSQEIPKLGNGAAQNVKEMTPGITSAG